jgi:uncharacterized protein YdhG (YjbR/CyaY superfamily)
MPSPSPRSPVQTIAEYLAALPAARRSAVATVRGVVKRNLPRGYRETIRQRMILYEVPLSVYPDTYNGHPLCYAAMAVHKTGISLYLMAAYGSPALTQRLKDCFREAGKKLDMGKSCIRFQDAEDLELDAIGEVVASTPLVKYVAAAKAAHAGR